MVFTEEDAKKIREHLLTQLTNFPKDKQEQIKKQITYLRSTYGIKESTPAAAAEDAVANIRGESSPSPFLNDAETKRRDAVIVQLRKIYADPATSAEEKKSIENRFKTNGISLQ